MSIVTVDGAVVRRVVSVGLQGPPGAPAIPIGGTTGQPLAKLSDANLDADWANRVVLDQLTIRATPNEAVTPGVGVLAWNDTDGTLDLGMKGGNVTQQIGMEQFILAKHASNAGITEGRVYYLSGASGGNKEVLEAQADDASTCKTTIGVAAESATGGAKALLTTFGLVRGLPDALFTNVTEGTVVYLSAATAGAFTSTPPTPPDHRVIVGFCVRKQSNNNELFVTVQTGLDVNELCDVFAPSPSAGQVLAWNNSNSRYELRDGTFKALVDVQASPWVANDLIRFDGSVFKPVRITADME